MAAKLDPRIKKMSEELSAKETRIVKLEKEVSELRAIQDDQEQYSRRESLRFSGIVETKDELTDALVLEVVNTKMKVSPPLQPSDIARSHRSGKTETGKTRQVLVKFTSYALRDRVIRARKALKTVNSEEEKEYMVTEDLTRERSFIAFKARVLKRGGTIKDTWTWDGRIYIMDTHGHVTAFTRRHELKKFDPNTSWPVLKNVWAVPDTLGPECLLIGILCEISPTRIVVCLCIQLKKQNNLLSSFFYVSFYFVFFSLKEKKGK